MSDTPARPRIRGLARRDDAILRNPSINGDNWHLTWADDDVQYSSLCDGYGPFERPAGLYNSRLIAIEGGPAHLAVHDVPGYPELADDLLDLDWGARPRYYNFGVLAVDGRIYQFLSTWPYREPENPDDDTFYRFMGVKAIFSPDGGRTWCNQDGSTPVVWEQWSERSRETMLFYEEPDDAFAILSVLQMGKGYAANRDGYVYVYAPNGATEGTMNQLVMFRVPTDRILDRSAYEYFAGRDAAGAASWSPSLGDRAVVHEFPSGWVNREVHPWAWVPSVTYDEPLGVYLMANWATGPGPEPEREWFSRPSYLGVWAAPEPWGPWEQIHEDTAWAPGGDLGARCYSPVLAPKWISADGRTLWLVWTDFQDLGPAEEIARRTEEARALTGLDRAAALAARDRIRVPYYSFNLQPIDLVVE